MKENKRIIIDEVTGELITKVNEDAVIKIYNTQQKEYDQSFNDKEDFLKFFVKNCDNLKKNLSFSEIGSLIYISKFICYEDGILRYEGKRTGRVLSIKDLAMLLDENEKSMYRTINNLKNKGVVCICDIGSIYKNEKNKKVIIVNPYIFCRGNTINNTIKALFIKSGWV